MSFARATLVVLALPALGACMATRGWTRTQMATQKAAIDAQITSSVTEERTARTDADNALRTDLTATKNDVASLKTDVTSLRTDLTALRGSLDSLRTEFGARITAFENGVKFALPVHFAFNDATVRDMDQPSLERFAAIAQKYYPGSKITIEGFADPAGSASYNKHLSKKRADAVKALLEQKGLLSTQLAAVGYGESRLIVPGAWGEKSGAELNRRVVFVIETAGDPGVVLNDAAQQ
jgi:peptidoglycan-associated lipoprotein